MGEITVNAETAYSINGLSFTDIELICLGLDEIHDDSMIHRKRVLLTAIENVIPELDRDY